MSSVVWCELLLLGVNCFKQLLEFVSYSYFLIPCVLQSFQTFIRIFNKDLNKGAQSLAPRCFILKEVMPNPGTPEADRKFGLAQNTGWIWDLCCKHRFALHLCWKTEQTYPSVKISNSSVSGHLIKNLKPVRGTKDNLKI